MPPDGVTIRTAERGDLDAIAAIERAAGELFLEWRDRLALDDGEPTPPDEMLAAIERGDVFVAVEAADAPVGFAHLERVDDVAHLAELDVDPAHGRQGIGRALVEHVAAVARERGERALTLTTFRDVPWNRPFYETAGFVVTESAGPGMRIVIEKEESWGLDFSQRCVMRRAL